MKTINIKGKDYTPVNERLKYFRPLPENIEFKDWTITEEIIEINNEYGIFKVIIEDGNGRIRSSAHCLEFKDSSYINKTSFLENGFTSALGRALGYLGIGIDTSIASSSEVQNAINYQKKIERGGKTLTQEAFKKTLEGTKSQAKNVLKIYNMSAEYRKAIELKFDL